MTPEREECPMERFPDFVTGLPELELPFEGVSGHLLQGERQQVVFVHFHQDTEVPEHSHRAQWEIAVAGEVRLRMAGEERTIRAGENFFIPEGVEHGASVRAGYRAVIIFDQADRYRAKGD
jgi:quercetin dioxygenase-like cupin family protein